MHAMIRRYADPGCASDEVVRAARSLAAVLDDVPGFISCVIVRPQSGGLALVTLFDEHANVSAAEKARGACLADHLPGLAEPYDLMTGEVVFQRGL